jgi:hypothetical protein
LQYLPRKLGNSAFLDIDGKVCVDQWAKLASIVRVSTTQLESLLQVLVSHNQISADEQSDLKPWQKHAHKAVEKISGCPTTLTIVLADQLYIPIQQLPGKLTSTLKYCAVFPNPEFYKRQAMHYSTFGTSRLIWSVHIENGYLILPRGCLAAVKDIFNEQDISLSFDDKRFDGSKLEKIRFAGKLKNHQSKAVNALLKQDNGVLVAHTGFGETVVALALIAKRKVNTLILVHSRQLAEQWQERAAVFLESVEVGSLLGGKNKLTGEVDIATYQSLINKNGRQINPAIEKYGQIIIDECHHLPAANYDCLIKSSAAKYIQGITATPTRQDGLEKLMHFQLGPVVHQAKVEAKSFEQLAIIRQTSTQFPLAWHDKETKPHISEVYKHLFTDQHRNEQIVKDIVEGFDLPYLDTLFITLPIAWKGILAQYAGRIQREWSNKELIRVFDYVDDFPMLKRMWAKREKGYKMLGYGFEEARRLL